jgi:hypothetical protein
MERIIRQVCANRWQRQFPKNFCARKGGGERSAQKVFFNGTMFFSGFGQGLENSLGFLSVGEV